MFSFLPFSGEEAPSTPQLRKQQQQQQQHILVVTIPLYGHYGPLKATAEALLRRGHVVSVLTERRGWCSTGLEGHKLNCVELPNSGTFSQALLDEVSHMEDYLKSFERLFQEIELHQATSLGSHIEAVQRLMNSTNLPKPTGVLTDFSTFVGADLGAKFDLPVVASFPLTLRLSSGLSPWLASLGLGMPRDLSFGQRILNLIVQLVVPVQGVGMRHRLNAVRAKYGIQPITTIAQMGGFNGPVLAPTIWPYDMPQPLCPNVVPLGTLIPVHDHVALEPELETFLSSPQCREEGVVYVNFGTMAQLSDRLQSELEAALFNETLVPQCIAWKPNAAHVPRLRGLVQSHKRRVYVTDRFASPVAVLRHPSTKAFVTHCGDTSLGEAVDLHLPLVGIPIFCDQVDVCQRMNETQIGHYVGTKEAVTRTEIASAIQHVTRHPDFQAESANQFRNLQKVRQYLGGPERGAEIVEAYVKGDASFLGGCSVHTPARLLGLPSAAAEDAVITASRSSWRQARATVTFAEYDVLLLFGVLPVCIVFVAMHWVLRRLSRWVRPGTP